MAEHLTEDEQVEAIKKWWKENGMAVIAGLVIGSAALFGWRGWNDHKDSQAADASVVYGEFQKGLISDNKDVITASKSQLVTDYAKTPYASLASLAVAKKAVESNDMTLAKSNLQWVLDNTRQNQVKHTARVRLIALMVNDAEYDAALAMLNIIDMGGYTAIYEELRGDILLAKGDMTAAHAAYDKALQSEGLSAAARDTIKVKYADTKPTVAPVVAEKPEASK